MGSEKNSASSGDLAGQLPKHDPKANGPVQSEADDAILSYLKEMNDTLREISKNAQNMSQSNVRNNIPDKREFEKSAQDAQERARERRESQKKREDEREKEKEKRREKQEEARDESKKRKKDSKSKDDAEYKKDYSKYSSGRISSTFKRILGDFEDSFESGLFEAIAGSDFLDSVKGSLGDIAKSLGIGVDDLPKFFGNTLGREVLGAVKHTKMGKIFDGYLSNAKSNIQASMSQIKDWADLQNISNPKTPTGDDDTTEYSATSKPTTTSGTQFFGDIEQILNSSNSILAAIQHDVNEIWKLSANSVNATEMPLPEYPEELATSGASTALLPIETNKDSDSSSNKDSNKTESEPIDMSKIFTNPPEVSALLGKLLPNITSALLGEPLGGYVNNLAAQLDPIMNNAFEVGSKKFSKAVSESASEFSDEVSDSVKEGNPRQYKNPTETSTYWLNPDEVKDASVPDMPNKQAATSTEASNTYEKSNKLKGVFDKLSNLKNIPDNIKNLGSKAKAGVQMAKTFAGNVKAQGFKGAVKSALSSKAGTAVAQKAATSALTKAGTTAMVKGGGMAMAGAGGTAGLAALGPYALIAVAAIVAIKKFGEALGPAREAIKEHTKTLKATANRDYTSSMERTNKEVERMTKDLNLIIEEPFKILKNAAEAAYQAWDSHLHQINATQGYTKDGLQDLITNYAKRLDEEGLDRVIASTDIIESLSKVLDSGLSGDVATEFAYLATKLNAAIPTQDFFGYAEAYSSIAANAIAAGQSQSEAIAYANSQIEQFASNVLYAGRQLSGGFSTGLKDAHALLDSSVKIANAAKTRNTSEISGVLTSISAIVGAIAPDLASGLVDSVVNAAIGGNSETTVALRSLAGINASNTEFLKEFANNPKQVFEAIFANLAEMQHMSESNYMEVAEGLSQIFGISFDALQRVDFAQLANAVASMQINDSSLQENLEHLASGETTTTAEQLKIAQINEYMLENGLAYVMDNEAARAIQEHMWDEQLALQLMEAQYGVELKGSALKLLEGLSQTTQKIIDLLNPFSIFRKISNIAAASAEVAAQERDLVSVITSSAVGPVTTESMNAMANLLMRGERLPITDSLVYQLTGAPSAYEMTRFGTSLMRSLQSLVISPASAVSLGEKLGTALTIGADVVFNSAIRAATNSTFEDSAYSYNSDALANTNYTGVGKSVAHFLKSNPSLALTSGSAPEMSSSELSDEAPKDRSDDVSAKISKMLQSSYLETYLDTDAYEDADAAYAAWRNSAVTQNIGDWEAALSTAGYKEEDLRSQFDELFDQSSINKAKEEERSRIEKEQKFWEDNVRSLSEIRTGSDFSLETLQTEITAKLQSERESLERTLSTGHTNIISKLTDIYHSLDSFTQVTTILDRWNAYFAARSYSNEFYTAAQVDAIKNKADAQQYEAIYALADALTQNDVNLTDPTLQTNALLSQILILINTLVQQNNISRSSSTLSNTLAGLAVSGTGGGTQL